MSDLVLNDFIFFRRILTYLISLRIIRGHLPSDELLNRFPVLKDLYMPFISAIKTGDLATYDKALDSAEHKLLELNLWLTLEKSRELCMRSLFRRAYALQIHFDFNYDKHRKLGGFPWTKPPECQSRSSILLWKFRELKRRQKKLNASSRIWFSRGISKVISAMSDK